MESVEYFADEAGVRAFSQANRDLNLFAEQATATSAAADDAAATAADPVTGENNGANGQKPPLALAPAVVVPPTGRRRARLVELYESTAVQRVIDDLAALGLDIAHYAAQDRPLFELVEGEGDRAIVHPLFSVGEILERVKENGRRGVQIKRFKGLGEMNAKELFATTMDPEHRKLLQVDLNETNAIAADKMFTLLMGDVVEPRRQFIEDNALNVRNLDV